MKPKFDHKKTTEKELKILSAENIKRIIDYLTEGHPLAIPFFLGLHTGMRVSEVCGLIWERVDLERGVSTVEQAMINVKREWVPGDTKQWHPNDRYN